MRTRVRLFLAGSLLAALLAIGIGSSPRALGASTPEEKVVGGPYVVSVGRRSATVIWLVETGQASVGLEPGKLDRTTPLLRTERIEFTGLAPGTYLVQSLGDPSIWEAGNVPYQIYDGSTLVQSLIANQATNPAGSSTPLYQLNWSDRRLPTDSSQDDYRSCPQ